MHARRPIRKDGPSVIGVMVLLATGALAPEAQAQAPSFEAIAVKESSGARIPIQWQGPRFVAGGVPLQTLLAVAYQVPAYQLAELPEWVRSVRWEISALASRVPAQAERMPLLRALLAERFRIVVRTETQERPLYLLTLARSDGRLGPGLTPTTIDCIALATKRAAGTAPAGGPECRVSVGPGAYMREGVPLAALSDVLTSVLQRPVVDKTGLTGFFNIELRYRPVTAAAGAPAAPSDAPDLVTAVTEQLGLKLESARGPMPVTVFDRLERPIPD